MPNTRKHNIFLKTGIFIFVLPFFKSNMVAQSIAQGNNICTFCDQDHLKIYYTPDNSVLLIEQRNVFICCPKDSSEKKITTFLSGKIEINSFDLDSVGEFDLYNSFFTPPHYTWRIAQIYDVDKDGNNDIVACSKNEIYWFRNNQKGKYSKVEKLANTPKGVNEVEFYNPIPGVVTAVRLDKNYNSNLKILDLRTLRNPKQYDYQVQQKYSWKILFGGANSINKILITDKWQIIANPKWCSSNFSSFKLENTDAFGIADFNNDGFGDVVNFKNNTTIVGWGNNGGTLKFGNDLMQVEDSVFFDQICKWNTDTTFYSKKTGEAMSLDWLSSGTIHFIDINSDGFQDFVWVGEYIVAFQNNTHDGFNRYFVGGPYDPGQVTAIDINGDKLLDIVVDAYQAQYALLNSGNGFKQLEVYEHGYQNGLVPIDADNDQDLDILILGKEKVLWCKNVNGELMPAVLFQK